MDVEKWRMKVGFRRMKHQTTPENKPPRFISLLGSNFSHLLPHEMELELQWLNNGIKTCTKLKDRIRFHIMKDVIKFSHNELIIRVSLNER
jgi:hypothetical protein